MHVRLGRRESGRLRLHRGNVLFGGFARDRIGLEQADPAVGGHLGDVVLDLRRILSGARLLELRVDFGGVDIGQEFARRHLGTDVLVPMREIAVCTRENRSFLICLHVGRQLDALHGRRCLRVHHRDHGNAERRGLSTQCGVRLESRQDPDRERQQHQRERRQAQQPCFQGSAGNGRIAGVALHCRILIVHIVTVHIAIVHDPSPIQIADTGAIAAVCASRRLSHPCTAANTTGTNSKVDMVPNKSPPITARPRGAFCSPPSPKPSAIGNMPITMASAVISTGRNRPRPASRAARRGSVPCANVSRAKLTTRMLLAVAMPMHMMVPVNAGTLTVVPVTNRIHTMPTKAAGSPLMMISGSSHDWKFTTMSRYTSSTAKASPVNRPVNEDCMVCTCPRTTMLEPAGKLPRA